VSGEKPLVPQGPELTAPASLRLVAGTLTLGFLATLLPWPESIHWLVPDFTLVVMLYWTVHAAHLVRLGAAFGLGLLGDASLGMLMGQHALLYTVAAFVALSLRRRLENFQVPGRALHLAPIFLAQQALLMLLGLVFDQTDVDWRHLAAGVSAALVWLPVAYLLDRLIGWSNVMHIEPADK
jgi:rod shape-determining protein MreD